MTDNTIVKRKTSKRQQTTKHYTEN